MHLIPKAKKKNIKEKSLKKEKRLIDDKAVREKYNIDKMYTKNSVSY